MEGILVILDGLGDRACKELGDKTPLESANKPNLDKISKHSKLGLMYPVNERFVPESDNAVVAILGNEVEGSYRGQFEAIGAEFKLEPEDLAFRTNFATIDNLKNKKIIDRRAGRSLSSKEAKELAEAINTNVKLSCKFVFQNTIQHRGVLILKGGFSDNITNTDPTYHSNGKLISSDNFNFSKALDEDNISEYTANIINDFIQKSFNVLDNHPINLKRKKNGLMPANILLTRDGAIGLPKLKKHIGWGSIQYMPLEIGISKSSGMEVFSFRYPENDADVYKNLYDGLKKACEFSVHTLKKENSFHNYFYVHFKETDIPGHDNRPLDKKKMIEYIDKHFFSFLFDFCKKNKLKIIVTGDHSTPCNLHSHSADAVPILFCDWKEDKEKNFSEKECSKGQLGKIFGKEVLKLFNRK